jgi:hypothetical protein
VELLRSTPGAPHRRARKTLCGVDGLVEQGGAAFDDLLGSSPQVGAGRSVSGPGHVALRAGHALSQARVARGEAQRV